MKYDENLAQKKISDYKTTFPRLSLQYSNNNDISKTFEYKEKFFKVKKNGSHQKSMSNSQNYFQGITFGKTNFHDLITKKELEITTIVPKPNKSNQLNIDIMKKTISNEILKLKPRRSESFSKYFKEKNIAAQKFNKEKESLRNMLILQKNRRSKLKLDFEENPIFKKLENMNQNFQIIQSNAKNGISKDPSKFIIYMDFQNEVKDKEFLLTNQKKNIEEQVLNVCKEYHQKKSK